MKRCEDCMCDISEEEAMCTGGLCDLCFQERGEESSEDDPDMDYEDQG